MSIIPGSGLNWGFSAQDLLNNGVAMYASVAGIVLLVLALAFAPMLVDFIKGIIGYYEPIESTAADADGESVRGFYELDDGSVWTYVETDEYGNDWYQEEDGSWEKSYWLDKYESEGTAGYFGD